MADRPRPRYAHSMRMRFLVVAAVGLALTAAVAGTLLDPAPPPAPPSIAFPALVARVASADRIELVHGGKVLWLERRGQVWGLARQGGYPARPGLAEALMYALLTMQMLKPAPGTFDTLRLADPFAPGDASGTLVRVLDVSGAVLCAVIVGPPGSTIVRRPGDDRASVANTPVTAPADAPSWSQQNLPPLDPGEIRAVLDDGGLSDSEVRQAVAQIEFVDAGPAPQHRAAPARTIQLELTPGTAVLTVSMEQGQPWLVVSGTAPWASRLAPYAFALPDGSPLAEF
jgi:hypothetical protein